ncbi:MAG: hypothetical protein K6C94_08070 [Candidatus Gastranaerophilales bacterium]|nr:hypothetical protein [Candidatus Gastranaerophilales bacterium]
MKKFLKILLYIAVNIVLILLIIFLCDICLYSSYLKSKNDFSLKNLIDIYKIDFIYQNDSKEYFSGGDNLCLKGRAPEGLQYKKSPILIFGCSFAYGHYLDNEYTFSHRLAEDLKRPVYNRAFCGAGFQHMYKQSLSENFFSNVPPSDTVIYVLIGEHFRRMFGETFTIYDNFINTHYNFTESEFVEDDYNNTLTKLIKKSPVMKWGRNRIFDYYLKNEKFYENISDEALAYFIKTRENLENKWKKKVKFIVFVYAGSKLDAYLIPKLKENGFIVITMQDLTKEDIFFEKYISKENLHPTKEAWDLVTPLFINEMKKEKVL